MSLRPSYEIEHTNISFFMNSYGERGSLVEGIYDNSFDAIAIARVPKKRIIGFPIGILLNDVVDIDLTQIPNWHRDEVHVGGKVSILSTGECRTNMIKWFDGLGTTLYHYKGPYLSNKQIYDQKPLGYVIKKPDKDGFTHIRINT